MTVPTPQHVLALPMPPNATSASAATIGEYLTRLLADLWTQGSDFNAKRPYGSSDWQWVVYEQLVKAGYVEGRLDGDGYIEHADIPAADRLISVAIQALGTDKERQ